MQLTAAALAAIGGRKACRHLLCMLAVAIAMAGGARAGQVLRNPTFTSWPHGSPVRGLYGGGRETAGAWIAKWGKSQRSVGTAARLSPAGGYRYVLQPAPAASVDGGETFYLRQYYRPLSASLGKRFRATIVLTARTPGIRGGWYVYPLWNATQRVFFINTVGELPLMAGKRAVYTIDFRVPTGKGVTFRLDPAHAGLAIAFLFTTAKPATVDIASFTLTRLP